jgi:hypothetical protein
MGSPRRNITGLDGWTVNEAAIIRRGWRRQPISNLLAYMPTIDFGPGYRGPVPAPGCSAKCPACLWMRDRSWHVDRPEKLQPLCHVPSTLRLVVDVVCFEFHGEPPHGWDLSKAICIDGDDWNLAAENVTWDLNAAAIVSQYRAAGLRVMRNGKIPSRRHRSEELPAGRTYSQPFFTGAANVPGHVPTSPQRRIGA